MTINLAKGSPVGSSGAPSLQGDPLDLLRARIATRIFDSYCDTSVRSDLIRYGVNDLGLDPSKTAIVIDMELESLGCANESKLTEELDSLLRRFTDQDKKLDPKERTDAIQMVCRPKPGYSKGLAFDVAERRVVEYCRVNRIKVKVGMFRWDIP